MLPLDPERLEAEARRALSDERLTAIASAVLERLGSSGSGSAEGILGGLLAESLAAISQNYFAQDWAAEHEYSVWARLNDDPRAWGYGSDEELAPVRWLVDRADCWFDGKELLPLHAWIPRFEAWANEQRAMVKRVTPGALAPDPRLDLG